MRVGRAREVVWLCMCDMCIHTDRQFFWMCWTHELTFWHFCVVWTSDRLRSKSAT